jgi:hypothetical protein
MSFAHVFHSPFAHILMATDANETPLDCHRSFHSQAHALPSAFRANHTDHF